jgi:hypothetical protein
MASTSVIAATSSQRARASSVPPASIMLGACSATAARSGIAVSVGSPRAGGDVDDGHQVAVGQQLQDVVLGGRREQPHRLVGGARRVGLQEAAGHHAERVAVRELAAIEQASTR